MDDKKIIKLNLEQENTEKQITQKDKKQKIFQSNPLLKKMFVSNIENKKGKFNFKDLFR
ncbi:MAG: hypothetical protein LUH05_01255 [Candidatus Gastranaerophilales bacterium]|nr:hypothetical protein [Candidatus Gastranaerophilales bacterium]